MSDWKARSAEAVERERRDSLWDLTAQSDVSGEVGRIFAGLDHVAVDDVVDEVRFDAGLLQRRFAGVDGEVGGSLILERAFEVAKGGALAG